MRVGIVYALYDARDGEIRYVGQTVQRLSVRLRQHRAERSTHRKCRWMAAIGHENVGIRALAIAEAGELAEAERAWIRKLREAGTQLTNLTDGGEYVGEAGRARLSAVLKGRTITWADKIAASKKGQRLTAETRLKISQASRGKPHSAAHNAAVSEGQRRRNALLAPTERSDIARRGRAGMTAERRAEIARKGHATRRARRGGDAV